LFSIEEQHNAVEQTLRARQRYFDYMSLEYNEILQKAIALDRITTQGEIVLSPSAIASMDILDLHKINPKAAKQKINESINPMKTLEPVIKQASQNHNVEGSLIKAVIRAESEGKNNAVSHEGAKGLMQLMPKTAALNGVTDRHDPIQNINGGTKYLKYCLTYFKGNKELALAGYNAGIGSVINAGYQIPDNQETPLYVAKVMKIYRGYNK
jgi:soluble lytic murein transglycosylase-like protein